MAVTAELTCTLRNTGFGFEASCPSLDMECQASDPEVAKELLRSLVEAELRANPDVLNQRRCSIFTITITPEVFT